MALEGKRLDLPLAELAKPGWYTVALYEQGPVGWRSRGYTPARWQTFQEHVDDLMRIDRGPTHAVRSWRWYNGAWYLV